MTDLELRRKVAEMMGSKVDPRGFVCSGEKELRYLDDWDLVPHYDQSLDALEDMLDWASENIDGAWRLSIELVEREWAATFSGSIYGSERDMSTPRAICLAALKAMGRE